MKYFLYLIIFILFLLLLAFIFWITKSRRYESTKSVASSYDKWTNDRLLEYLWGEHIHLGYYHNSSISNDFKAAKVEFVHQLVRWSGLNKLPRGSKILDVGCGIGGSSRILARDYGFDVLGISISPSQVNRANQLTPKEINCRFLVMDASDLKLKKDSFDGVWSVEAGPHMVDKQLFADEMLRVLRPGGLLAVADWNRRSLSEKPMTMFERYIMSQLLNQWTHPEFSSINGFKNNLLISPYRVGLIDTSDWTKFTIDSWNDSIIEGFRRPGVFLRLGPSAFLKGIKEIPTILMMRWAFEKGLMQFGVFRTRS